MNTDYLDQLRDHGLITNTYNKLVSNKITTRDQLVRMSWIDVGDLRGVGVTGLESLIIAMSHLGDRLRPEHMAMCSSGRCQCEERYWTKVADDRQPGPRQGQGRSWYSIILPEISDHEEVNE